MEVFSTAWNSFSSTLRETPTSRPADEVNGPSKVTLRFKNLRKWRWGSHHADSTAHPTATCLPGASVGTNNRDSIPARLRHLSREEAKLLVLELGQEIQVPHRQEEHRNCCLCSFPQVLLFQSQAQSSPAKRMLFCGPSRGLTITRPVAISPESCKSTPRPAHPGRAVYQSESGVALEMKRGGQLFLRNTQKLEINDMALTEVPRDLSVADRPTIS